MAAPPKRQCVEETQSDEVRAYVHSVSQVKTSAKNTKYFDCVLQTAEQEYHRGIIVFSADKHQRFAQAAFNQTAVKINNVRRDLRRSGNKLDIQINQQSSVEVIDLPFEHKTPNVHMTVKDVLAMQPNEWVGEIKVKIIDMTSSEIIHLRDSDVELRHCTGADSTGRIKLTVWEYQVPLVNKGQSYSFKHLLVSKRNGIYLTLTHSTNITVIPEVYVPAQILTTHVNESVDMLNTIKGEVAGIFLKEKWECPYCTARLNPRIGTVEFVRCIECNLLQKASNFLRIINGTIIVNHNNSSTELTLSNSAVRSFQLKQGIQTPADTESLEIKIMRCENMLVEFNDKNIVTDMTPCDTEPQASCSVRDLLWDI